MTDKDQRESIEASLFSDTSRYADIYDHDLPKLSGHYPLPLKDYAGQFAPFAALTGYHGLINEVADRYQRKHYHGEAVELRVRKALASCAPNQEVTIHYFNGESGYYETVTTKFLRTDAKRDRAYFSDLDVPIANIDEVKVK